MTVARPIGLADLIRENRHILELRLATPSELSAITGDVKGVGAVKGYLRGWRVIAMCDHSEGVTSLHFVGSFDMRSWITSDLLVLSPDRSVARTRNSLYGLGQPADSDLSVAHLRTVAMAITAWGLAAKYGLKVVRDDDLADHDDA